jgi:SAM-dependent methyltransferase
MHQEHFGREITAPGLHAALINEILLRSTTTNVLDLGCGEGAWMQRLQSCGFGELVGIDWSADGRVSGNLTIRRGDIESDDLGLGNATFGLVSIIEVIEHMGNAGKLLSHASRHLADDGLVLLTTPNIHSLIQRLKFLITGRFTHFDHGSDPTHYQPLLLEAWRRMLPRYGLEVATVWTYPNSNRLDGIHQGWRYLAAMLQPLLRNELPGEVLCILLRRVTG